MGSLGLCNLLQTPDLHSQGEGSHAQRRWREARLSLHVLPGHGKCCSCCPWGQLWFVRTNYFSASAKCLGLHGSQASVPVAATDPAMDGGGGGQRNADGVSHPWGPSMETHSVLYSIPHLPPLIIQLSLRLWTCSSITLQRWMQRPGEKGVHSGLSSTICKHLVPIGADPQLFCCKVSLPGDPRREPRCLSEPLPWEVGLALGKLDKQPRFPRRKD